MSFQLSKSDLAVGLFVSPWVLFSLCWGLRYGRLDGDNCWVVSPHHTRERNGHKYNGLAGSDHRIATESDHLFAAQYIFYVIAVACSAVGLVFAIRLRWQLRRTGGGSYAGNDYRLYTVGLCLYFCSALAVNFITSTTFTEYRCHYHNVGWRDGMSVATSGARWAKTLFMTGNYWGGFFTNIVMDLVLVYKAAMIQSDNASERVIRLLRLFILAQLVLFMLFLPMEVLMWKSLMVSGKTGVFGEGDGILYLGRFAAAAFGLLHVASSVTLVHLFVRPLLNPDVLDIQGQTLKLGVVRRVVFISVVAISSTFVCYVNIGLGFANSYIMLVLDSIVNDVCMVLVSFGAPVEDAELSQEAKHGAAAKPITIGSYMDTELEMADEAGIFVDDGDDI